MDPVSHVDGDRVRTDLLDNAAFGAVDASDGRGRTVLTGSPADEAARNHLIEILESLGCTVRVDPVGNIAGRWVPPGGDPDAAPVAIGSHLDSVPRGGIFDGPLGVFAGVETIRALAVAGAEIDRPIEVVAFTEEEGIRFGRGLLGSSVAAGAFPVEDALALTDDTGTTLEQRLAAIGMHGEASITPADWEAWFEIHIEQGTVLEEAMEPIGVVSAITGVSQGSFEIVGRADHAGATGMDNRIDALAAASAMIRALEDRVNEVVATDSTFATLTVGNLEVSPGATNVVPERVEASLDIRDTDPEVIDGLYEATRAIGARIERERGVAVTIERSQTVAPTELSGRCRDALTSAAGNTPPTLPSGGGHDTMHIAEHTDTGMLFVRSQDGLSHTPQEFSRWEDCTAAVQALVGAVTDIGSS